MKKNAKMEFLGLILEDKNDFFSKNVDDTPVYFWKKNKNVYYIGGLGKKNNKKAIFHQKKVDIAP